MKQVQVNSPTYQGLVALNTNFQLHKSFFIRYTLYNFTRIVRIQCSRKIFSTCLVKAAPQKGQTGTPTHQPKNPPYASIIYSSLMRICFPPASHMDTGRFQCPYSKHPGFIVLLCGIIAFIQQIRRHILQRAMKMSPARRSWHQSFWQARRKFHIFIWTIKVQTDAKRRSQDNSIPVKKDIQNQVPSSHYS